MQQLKCYNLIDEVSIKYNPVIQFNTDILDSNYASNHVPDFNSVPDNEDMGQTSWSSLYLNDRKIIRLIIKRNNLDNKMSHKTFEFVSIKIIEVI